MENEIFGYTFDEISKAQQGGRLGRIIDLTKPAPFDPVQERADLKLLHNMGEAKLREIGYMGVIDRLQRAGYLTSNVGINLPQPQTTCGSEEARYPAVGLNDLLGRAP